MIDSDRKIIEAEIERLEGLWQAAQERYGVTGSRSTDKTMTKYRVLQEALESTLNDNRLLALEHSNALMMNQLANLRQIIARMTEAGKIPVDVAKLLTQILVEA